jgi:serine/threonine protein kinase
MESIIKLLFTLPDSVTNNIKGKTRIILETNKNNISLLGKKFKEIVINSLKNKKSYLENIIKTQKKEVVINEVEKEILNNLSGFNSQIKEFSNYITLNCESIKEIINQVCNEKIDNFYLSETKLEEKILDEIRPKIIDIYDDIYGRKGIFDIFSKTSNSEYCETFINTINDNFSKIMDSTILANINNLIRYFTSLLNSINEVNDILLNQNEIIAKKLFSLQDLIKNPNYKEKYINLKKIGEGGYGVIYKANIKNTNELRALKVINKELLKENITKNFILADEAEEEYKKCINCFMNEIENMKICSQYNTNNNSVKFYEYYDTEKEFIIVMELCDDNLFSLLQERKKGLNKEEIYNIMNQLNYTFKIMNKNKIIHRDIKLENIVVKYNDKSKKNYIVKLTDYGISKQLINTKGRTNVGTSLTMAPEILKGEGEIYDNKCDLWSIGIIIYQLYFKDYPYKGITDVAIYNQIKNLGKKILKRTNNNNLNNLIDSLLIIDPRERINYEEYFNHPFFKEYLNNIKINNNNYIISEIEIKEDNKNERIISSYEEFYKENKDWIEKIEDEEERKMLMNEENKNEKEIKKIVL